jgi:hypothetical protein
MKRPRSRGWLVTLPIVVAVTLAGCGHPLIPASIADPTPSHRPFAGTPARPVPGTDRPVLGVDLYVKGAEPPATVRREGARDLTYMHRTLGAQSAGIVWNLYSPGNASATVSRTSITLSPAGVATLTKLAEAKGMSVEYRPLIRVGPSQTWEGFISPPAEAAWFASFYQAELPYLRLAQQLHVREFVVGTELHELNSSPFWRAFLDKVRKVYHGIVSVSSFQGQYYRGQLLPLTDYGMDPYPDIKLPDNATVGQLTAAWEALFARVPAGVREQTMMEEVGFISEDGAYQWPQLWSRRGPVNWRMQARWFTAACRTVAQWHMRGIYFYEMPLEENPASPMPFPAYFEGRPAARSIKGCLAIFKRSG